MTRAAIFSLFIALIAAIAPAAAFKMTPIVLIFATAGRDSTRAIILENQSGAPEAIELAMHRRRMSPDGEDLLEPAEEDFIITPAQVILMPNQQQTVRIQWLGGALEKERAYRLIAEQLPIDIGAEAGEGGQVRFLVRYVASLYVAPADAAPEIEITQAAIEDAEDGLTLAFTVQNSGDAHVALSDLSLAAYRGAEAEAEAAETAPLLALSNAEIGELSGSVILAEHARRFRISLAEGVAADIAPGPVRLVMDYGAR